jgi:putative ABC transport system substrate-binding protein
MKRREFITFLGSAAATWPLAARAQQPNAMKRIGVLMSTAEAEFRARFEPFRDKLSQLGWMEPRNVRIDYRWTDNKPDLTRARARELVGSAPDVILATPGPVVEVLQQLTRTIPIVFVTSTDPVRAGYVESFARPGGNITGFTIFEATLNTKFLELLKDVAPQVNRVSVFRLGGVAQGRRDFAIIEEAARSFGVAPVETLVQDDAADIDRAIAAFAREPRGGLIVPPDNRTQKHHGLIVALAGRHRLPAIYYNRLFVDAGGLMSYGGRSVGHL